MKRGYLINKAQCNDIYMQFEAETEQGVIDAYNEVIYSDEYKDNINDYMFDMLKSEKPDWVVDDETFDKWLDEESDDDTALFTHPCYVSAIEGISEGGRLIYNYERMAEFLMEEKEKNGEIPNDADIDDYDAAFFECFEFIDYNVVRTVPYMGDKAPLISHEVYDYEYDSDFGEDENITEI